MKFTIAPLLLSSVFASPDSKAAKRAKAKFPKANAAKSGYGMCMSTSSMSMSVGPEPPVTPAPTTAPTEFIQFIDEGQSCCGECWCIPDESTDGLCPDRTTAFPQLYPLDMVYNFGNKTLVDPDTFDVVTSNNLYELECNPYEGVSANTNPPWAAYQGCNLTPPQLFSNTSATGYDDAVCAFLYPDYEETGNCDTYTYKTYPSKQEAEDDGAVITHTKQCGVCSNAQDLSVFLAQPDLTSAGIACSLKPTLNGKITCYQEDVGFTYACAQIWARDSQHDSQYCVCLGCNPDAPPYGPPPTCALGSCVECDDERSGPTFNAYSGRTRRRSGIWSALARTCSSIERITQKTCPNQIIPDNPICEAQQNCTANIDPVPNPFVCN